MGDFVKASLECRSSAPIEQLNYLSLEAIDRRKYDFADMIKASMDAQAKCKVGQIISLIEQALLAERGYRGLGDVVAHAARALGVHKQRGCGCERRQARLNGTGGK